MTTTAPTHINPEHGARNSFQARYYNIGGDLIGNIGHHDQKVFEAKRNETDRSLVGKWAFALIMTKDKRGVREQAIFFPNGKCEVLVEGAVAINAPSSKGTWVNYSQVLAVADRIKWKGSVRFAPDSRFPWKSGSAECRVEEFPTVDAMAKWISEIDPARQVLFVANPASGYLPPDKEMFYVLCASVPA